LLIYTSQELCFRRDFKVALTVSKLKAKLKPLSFTTIIDYKKAQSHLHFLVKMDVNECWYTPTEANEVENEHYRSLSHPQARKLIDDNKALIIPRMAIRDILGEIESGLKFYFVTRDSSKSVEFSTNYNKLEMLRSVDTGNPEFDQISINNK
jgi:hypothetical protein